MMAIDFRLTSHQRELRVWDTQLNDQGSYQPIDLE